MKFDKNILTSGIGSGKKPGSDEKWRHGDLTSRLSGDYIQTDIAGLAWLFGLTCGSQLPRLLIGPAVRVNRTESSA